MEHGQNGKWSNWKVVKIKSSDKWSQLKVDKIKRDQN